MALFGRPTAEDQQRADAWRYWLQSRNPLAIASLVLGIFSLIEFGALLIFGIAGVVLGVMALSQLRSIRDGIALDAPALPDDPPAQPNPYEAPQLYIPKIHGRGLAWSGILLSAASLAVAAVIYLGPHLRRR
jgi:hypothetical protein